MIMNIALIAALCAILLGLIVAFNIMAQQKQRIESNNRQELAKYITVIDATEELIGNAHNLPFSATLLICLNQKIIDTLNSMYHIDKLDNSLPERMAVLQSQIEQIKQTYQNKESTSFRIPDTDREAISMLKLIKRLRGVIKAEHTKGRLTTQGFIAENTRLEQMQMKVNIENVLKRVNNAKINGQYGTALQLLKKAIEIISVKNDPYSTSLKETLSSILLDINETLDKSHEEAKPMPKENDALDELFTPKKKW